MDVVVRAIDAGKFASADLELLDIEGLHTVFEALLQSAIAMVGVYNRPEIDKGSMGGEMVEGMAISMEMNLEAVMHEAENRCANNDYERACLAKMVIGYKLQYSAKIDEIISAATGIAAKLN